MHLVPIIFEAGGACPIGPIGRLRLWFAMQFVAVIYGQGWRGGSVAQRLACWTQAQKGLGSNRSRDAVAYQS